LIGPAFGFFAIDTQQQVEVIVHGAKAPYRDCKNLIEFFEALVDPIFALETVLIGQQISLAAASGNAVIPTTYGRINKSEASFSHSKSPTRNNRFSQQNLSNRRTNAIRCACPFFLCNTSQSIGGIHDRRFHFFTCATGQRQSVRLAAGNFRNCALRCGGDRRCPFVGCITVAAWSVISKPLKTENRI
jgi:hypothetical protein